jgi:hypothetical protein
LLPVIVLAAAKLFEPPKLVVVMGDSGINSGGGAIAVPMLVQPPLMAVTPAALRVVAAPTAGEFVGQPGAAEVAVGVVGQGDATPPRAVPLVVPVFVDVAANGFDDVAWLPPRESWSFAARMPASTPSRTAVPVSENAP